eukprot:GFYU01011552.1.p1 GENE.GFYU01011552.1~~GFYU01011552.1.p1  ORF type:complete len:269 (+),score=65.43 GFYU01011552.1:42-848(+)
MSIPSSKSYLQQNKRFIEEQVRLLLNDEDFNEQARDMLKGCSTEDDIPVEIVAKALEKLYGARLRVFDYELPDAKKSVILQKIQKHQIQAQVDKELQSGTQIANDLFSLGVDTESRSRQVEVIETTLAQLPGEWPQPETGSVSSDQHVQLDKYQQLHSRLQKLFESLHSAEGKLESYQALASQVENLDPATLHNCVFDGDSPAAHVLQETNGHAASLVEKLSQSKQRVQSAKDGIKRRRLMTHAATADGSEVHQRFIDYFENQSAGTD